MVNSSKILTVSYGTFSCTLEGFDDSFDTMKAIAEYFRDLASDDRYFGAEPPTPDAEMLARIAEREIARRVEAREEQGKIVLRADQAMAMAPQLPDATHDEALPEETATEAEQEEPSDDVAVAEDTAVAVADEISHAPAEIAETPVSPAPETDNVSPVAAVEETNAAPSEPEQPIAEPVAEDEADEGDSDSVAAKLRRIRSVVSHGDTAYAADDYSEDEHAQDLIEGGEPSDDFLKSTVADLSAVLAEDDAVEPVQEEAEATAEADDVAEDEAEHAEASPDLAEAETVDEDDDGWAAFAAATTADADDEDDAEADSAAVFDEDDTTDEDEDVFAAMEAERSASDLDESAPVDVADEDEDDVYLAEDTLAQLLADATPSVTADDAEPDTGFDDDEATNADESIAAILNDEATAEDTPSIDAELATLNDAEFEEETTDAELSELAEDDTDFGDTFGESTLSPEEEADLQRELAEVEAGINLDEPAIDDIAEDLGENDAYEASEELAEHDKLVDEELDAPETNEAEIARAETSAKVGDTSPRGISKLDDADSESDVSRIFDEAKSQLGQPESSKRRSAIQHLRAAVAATRAEKRAGRELTRDVDDTPYRSDLASVVRPRRPRIEGSTTRSIRPDDDRPAPLKLVAEQRIDAPRDPVRPRRISSADMLGPDDAMAETDSNNSFPEFAEEMGATELPALLEAAAAYMSDVEGRPQFSRPMLMGKLKEVRKEDFSREDGLRSFGQLLREGKLQKLRGGRFAITDETDYRLDDARHAS